MIPFEWANSSPRQTALVISIALRPMTVEKNTMTDLSSLRNFLAVIGALISFIPFVIVYKSVSKFRKILMG